MKDAKLDLLIFGATGFTGKYTVKEAERLCKVKPFSWGVAGRNKEALLAVLKNFAPESGKELINKQKTFRIKKTNIITKSQNSPPFQDC